MNMEAMSTGAVMLTLLVGTPAISFIGAVGAAVAVALPRGGLLGVDPDAAAGDPDPDFRRQRVLCRGHRSRPVLPPFMILSAIALFFAALGPVAAGALRGASD
jgi:heme exporter protein B